MSDLDALAREAAAWRRAMHEHPGLAYEEHFAAGLAAQKLTEWGIPFKSGIGKTGIVAFIEGKTNLSGRTVALRADMDALPIAEDANKPWASKVPGKMHACGHDGHTAILLAAAKYLNDTKNFDGRVMLIFQPAEEGARGANAMIADGLFTGDMACDEIYALHNWPAAPLGRAGTRVGPFQAASDRFTVTLTGKGGHAAYPEECRDPVIAAAALTTALQAVVSRNVPPNDSAVVSVTNIQAGTGAANIIPDTAVIFGTARSYSPAVRDTLEKRIREKAEGIAATFNVAAQVRYTRIIDATINTPAETRHAADALCAVFGAANVDVNAQPSMGGEDFGAMLERVPGAYVHIGQATADPAHPCNQGLHTAGYDFNDDLIIPAMRFFATLVENRLPLKAAAAPSAPAVP